MASHLDYRTEVRTIDGRAGTLEPYRGKALLIVNTATECGFTPQFEGLQRLWEDYGPRGLMVLGFPCNQFGSQEPRGPRQIQEFCKVNYGVTFPMHKKVEVNGPNTHLLYRQLKKGARGFLGSRNVKWNFTKFLVDPEGRIVARFAPTRSPESLHEPIEAILDAAL
ncbi:MAG: glutathione peroxidase [Myxococcota bacterium]